MKKTRNQTIQRMENGIRCAIKRLYDGKAALRSKRVSHRETINTAKSPKNIIACYDYNIKVVKILYLITKSNWGGAQRYAYDLATNLPKDFSIAVACGGSGPLVQKLREKNIRVINISKLERDINLFSEFVVFFQLLKLFTTEKPDVIHVNSSKIGGLGAFAGRLSGVPKMIFTVHGWPFNEDRPLWQRKIIYFLTWLTILFSHKVITVCTADYNQFKSKKVVLTHNGI